MSIRYIFLPTPKSQQISISKKQIIYKDIFLSKFKIGLSIVRYELVFEVNMFCINARIACQPD